MRLKNYRLLGQPHCWCFNAFAMSFWGLLGDKSCRDFNLPGFGLASVSFVRISFGHGMQNINRFYTFAMIFKTQFSGLGSLNRIKMEKKIFRSRISVLMTSLIALPFSALLIFVCADQRSIIVNISVLVLCAVLFSSIRYVIDGQILRVKCCGISFGKFDINEICLIKRTYNPMSSPAASLKRLAIYRRHRRTGQPALCAVISPVRENEFVANLKAVNPMVVIQINDSKKWRIWDWDI